MRVLITILIVAFLALMGPLMPQWTPSAIGVYTAMCVMGTGVVLALWIRSWCNPILRVLAVMLAGLMFLNAANFVISQVANGGSLFGFRTPLVGFIIVGLPALMFAISGRPKVENFFGPVRTDGESTEERRDR